MLTLRLKPNEKILINGSVMSNGGKDPITLLLHNEASVILRESDVMKKLPECPNVFQHLYYLTQEVYANGNETLRQELIDELNMLIDIFQNEPNYLILRNLVLGNEYYKVIKELKKWRGNELSK